MTGEFTSAAPWQTPAYTPVSPCSHFDSVVACFFLLPGIQVGCGLQDDCVLLQQGLLSSCLRALQLTCHIVKHLLCCKMWTFMRWTSGKNALLQFSLAFEQGSDSMTLRNPVAVGEDTRVSGRMCFNTAFLFLLLLACWLMVSLFWLRITTALLVHLLACLTTWSILGCCTSFYLHQSWQVCSIMFLLVVSHFYTIYADGHAWNYSWFQLHRELLERFPRRAKELRSVRDHLYKWDIYMSVGLGRMYLRLLGRLANIIAEAHCNILDRLWSSGEVPAD